MGRVQLTLENPCGHLHPGQFGGNAIDTLTPGAAPGGRGASGREPQVRKPGDGRPRGGDGRRAVGWFGLTPERSPTRRHRQQQHEPGESGLRGVPPPPPGAPGVPDRLLRLVVLVALSVFSDGEKHSSAMVLRWCSGRMIFSSMSPITWKLGSTIKSMKPEGRNQGRLSASRSHCIT